MIEKWAMKIKNKSEKRTLHRLRVSGGAFLVWAMSKGSSPSEDAPSSLSSPNSVGSRTLAPDSISMWRPDNDVGSKPLVEEEEPRDVMALLPCSPSPSPSPYVVVSVCRKRYGTQLSVSLSIWTAVLCGAHIHPEEVKITVRNDVAVFFFFWAWLTGSGGLICFDLLKIAPKITT